MEPVLPASVESASAVKGALRINPSAKLIALDRVVLRDTRVTVALNVLFENPEPRLPRGCSPLNEAHVESPSEVPVACSR